MNSALISRESTIIPLNGADGLVTNHFHHTQQLASLLPNGICQYNENSSLMEKKKENITCESTNKGDKREESRRLDIQILTVLTDALHTL